MDGVSGGVQLEASHPIRVRRILGVQDVVAASRGERVDVVLGDEDVVDPAAELVVVAGDHRDAVQRIADVEDHQAVLPVGGPLAADHAEHPVFGDLHVVHGPGVHPHRVDQGDRRGVGDVPEVGVAVGAVGAGDRVVAAVNALPDPEIRGAPVADGSLPDHFHVLADVPRHHRHRRAGGGREAVGDHRVGAGALRHEGAVLVHLPDGARSHDPVGGDSERRELHRVVGHRVPRSVHRRRGEEHHVTGPHGVLGRPAQRDGRRRVGEHLDRGVARCFLGGDGDAGHARAHQGEHPEGVHARHRRVGAAPAHFHVVADRPRDVGDQGAEADLGPRVEVAREVHDLDGGHRGIGDGHRDLDPHRGLGPPGGVLGILRHHGDQGVLAGAVGLDDARRVHAHRAPAAREEHHRAVHRVALGVPDLGLERQRVPDLELDLGRRDDELRGLRALFRLPLFLGERREGEEEKGGSREGSGAEVQGSIHGWWPVRRVVRAVSGARPGSRASRRRASGPRAPRCCRRCRCGPCRAAVPRRKESSA